MAKKASKKEEAEPLRLFYIFYNQERWDNWLKTLQEASFEADPKSDELPEGFRILDGFAVDITVSVLKIVKLYQNKRFSFEEAVDRLSEVEKIIMAPAPAGELGELVEILQLPKLALFASCRLYLAGVAHRSHFDQAVPQGLHPRANLGIGRRRDGGEQRLGGGVHGIEVEQSVAQPGVRQHVRAQQRIGPAGERSGYQLNSPFLS